MRAQRDSDQFTFHVEHIGLDMDFYHPKGRDLGLSLRVIEAFEETRENAEIFVQNSTGLTFSGDELLDWFLLQTGTTLQDHVPEEKLDTHAGHIFVTFPIRFEQGTFHMDTEDGPQDLSSLKLMAKVSYTPRDVTHTAKTAAHDRAT